MVFEPKYTKVVSSVRKNIGITQSVVEVKLPTNENNISQIYSVGAKSAIVSNEASGRDIFIIGQVDVQAVYQSDEIVAIDYCAEFKDRFSAEDVVSGELVINSNVVDISSSIVSGGIKVVAIVEVVIDEIVSSEINVLTEAEGEGAHLSTNDVSYTSYLGRAYEKFDVTGDLSIKGATNILMVTPSVSILRVDPKDNYLVINGELNLDVCYQTGENAYDISTQYHCIDFSWEVAFDGITTESIVQSSIGLISNEIKLSTLIENGVANMNVFVPVAYSGYIFNESMISVVDDLYLEKNYLSITCENFNTITCNNSILFKDNISGTASISETAPFIDDVLGVSTNNLILASSRIENGKVIIEGVANSTVVYYTKETGELTSVQVDMPFSVEQKVDGKIANVVTICLENMSARSKRGKEIEVSAELQVYIDVYSGCEKNVITQVIKGEEKAQEDCSLYIYVVKPEQTIWEVAKDMSTSQELILEQNPDVELPLKAGDKLVIYKPSLIRF